MAPRSAAGDELTRIHVEAGIAWEHCRAPTFADTDWRRLAELYDTLDRIARRAELPQPGGRRSLSARPASRPPAAAPFFRKAFPPVIRSARGEGRAPFPPRPRSAAKQRLAGSPTLYHCPRRSRIFCVAASPSAGAMEASPPLTNAGPTCAIAQKRRVKVRGVPT